VWPVLSWGSTGWPTCSRLRAASRFPSHATECRWVQPCFQQPVLYMHRKGREEENQEDIFNHGRSYANVHVSVSTEPHCVHINVPSLLFHESHITHLGEVKEVFPCKLAYLFLRLHAQRTSCPSEMYTTSR